MGIYAGGRDRMILLKEALGQPRTRRAALIPLLLSVAALAACDDEAGRIAYVCEEPLEKYLELARGNIEKDYAIERSRKLLSICPDKAFHRKYRFEFPSSALVSKRAAAARVEARWCGDPEVRTSSAEVRLYTSTLVFAFNYPWSTETGKYPRTEFHLNMNDLTGGFSADRDWQCVLVSEGDMQTQAGQPLAVTPGAIAALAGDAGLSRGPLPQGPAQHL